MKSGVWEKNNVNWLHYCVGLWYKNEGIGGGRVGAREDRARKRKQTMS